ncbi:MAG: zinc metallopeptidase [Candidatus Bostrichicola ureolyticus]|nr:MAG: zinc metallopeptidase [Candidatus Bostrichicola ureolyticus]
MNIYNIIILIFFLLGVIINCILHFKLKNYSKIELKINLTGKEIAEKMLNYYGLNEIKIIPIDGQLIDHYNTLYKTVNLSYETYNNKNITSVAIATHECGHAIQHKVCYSMFTLRSKLIPIINFCSQYINLVIIIGLYIYYNSNFSLILKIGIGLFFLIVMFSFITLPIEFDASTRALIWLNKENIVTTNEFYKIKDSLKWAAMTYVITALSSLFQFIYFFSIFNKNENK